MAPLPESSTLTTLLTSLLRRIPSASAAASPAPLSAPQTEAHYSRLSRRNEVPGAGVTPITNIPNKAVFAIFGILGAGFVLTGIWFFFWAKNGGFYFHENDWEEYKSTVLRRKGPNGTTLSGATESTDLGGGSIVHGQDEKSVWGRIRRKGKKGKKQRYEAYRDHNGDETTEYLGSGGGSSIGESQMSELRKEKRRAARKESSKPAAEEKKSRFRRKRNHDAPTEASEAETLTVADPDEEVDIGVQDTMRAYRHEKPARVGGLNKPADGSSWDGSTEASSDLMSHREPTPTNTPTKIRKERNDRYTGGNGGSGANAAIGIRKVVSTSQPSAPPAASSNFWARSITSSAQHTPAEEAERERERVRAEAKKLQEKGRAASSRRDFSFQHGDDNSTVISGSSATTSEDAEREARREARREERAARRREGGGSSSRSPTKKDMPGSFHYEESEIGSSSVVSGDTGTKSYHHHIPGLSSSGGNAAAGSGGAGADEYKEERRKRRAAREGGDASGGGGGGYRRGR